MNRLHVTLPQILVAASTRHANMVPESVGYFILALCETIGCLPLNVPDNAIELSADGAVTVAQQGKVVQAAEAAQAMRELFARLLAVTTGPTPRLAAVARPRELSLERGVDAFAAEVEAALVPMNRAAGKRSLGRLARETLRAIESGTLALHLQARAAAKEAPAAAAAAIAPLIAPPPPAPKPTFVLPHFPAPPLTPPPSLLGPRAETDPFAIFVTPTTPGLGLETIATEAHVDSSIFGATPTCKEGDALDVEPKLDFSGALTPGFDSPNTSTVSCDPTQLSARDVQIDPSLRAPRSDEAATVVSTKERVRRVETPRSPQEITLASAGVEPVTENAVETPAPSAPEVPICEASPQVVAQDFADCHDGQTQSAPKYEETLVGLAPVARPLADQSGPASVEALESSDYVLVTPSALPQIVDLVSTNAAVAPPEDVAPQAEELSSELLHTASPSRAVAIQADSEAPPEFQPLDVPSDEPGRVDELLGTFGRPEEGEEAMLRRTASSLKELAGLEPTPCAPSVSPAIRVPHMLNRATPAWVPEAPRQTPTLERAPLVQQSRGWRAKLKIPFALFIALAAGFVVVHWRLPEVVLRLVRPVETKTPATAPAQAAVEQDVYVEP